MSRQRRRIRSHSMWRSMGALSLIERQFHEPTLTKDVLSTIDGWTSVRSRRIGCRSPSSMDKQSVDERQWPSTGWSKTRTQAIEDDDWYAIVIVLVAHMTDDVLTPVAASYVYLPLIHVLFLAHTAVSAIEVLLLPVPHCGTVYKRHFGHVNTIFFHSCDRWKCIC